MTVGELRKLLENVPDTFEVLIEDREGYIDDPTGKVRIETEQEQVRILRNG